MMREPPLPGDSFLTPASEVTLVEQIVYWYRARTGTFPTNVKNIHAGIDKSLCLIEGSLDGIFP